MSMIDVFAAELQREEANTRKLFERIPESRFPWQPHAKSMSVGKLASHITEILTWVDATLNKNELAMNPGEFKPYMAANKTELLAKFDANVADALKQMKGRADDLLMKTWRFKIGGKVILEMPKAAVLRAFVLSHTIHHRGQMTVFLRLNNVPVLQTSGPTADEPGF